MRRADARLRITGHLAWLLLALALMGGVAAQEPTAVWTLDTDGTAGAYQSLPVQLQAGRETPLIIEVRNGDTSALRSIVLAIADAPSGWEVTLLPTTVDVLAPGEGHQIALNVRPPWTARSGERYVSLTATTGGVGAYLGLRVQVTNRLWAPVGAALGVLAIAAFALIYRRVGREDV